MNKNHDIPVKCTRCRHQCMESDWLDKPDHAIGGTVKVCPKCGCKSYYDMRPQVAWCWASGLIEMGDKAPQNDDEGCGVIVIAAGPKCELKLALEASARRGRGAGAGQLLVPGVPEAETQKAAGDALDAWLVWASNTRMQNRNGVQFLDPRKSIALMALAQETL